MTALRNAIVAGDGRLHATAAWLVGGATLCGEVSASVATRAVTHGRYQPVVTCQGCRQELDRVAHRQPVRAA